MTTATGTMTRVIESGTANSNLLSLVKYDAMCLAIEAARAVDEAKDIRDKALAIQAYAKQAKNLDAERHAAEIRVRAERRCGELLAEMPKAKGAAGNPGGQGAKIVPSEDTRAQTLAQLGISYDQSSQWQQLAALPGGAHHRRAVA
jgi:hypothetical protein